VLGLPLAISDYAGVVSWMESMIDAGARGYLTAAAVNLVMSARASPDVREAVQGAALVVPDGQPLVWALHALGHPGATRVYGPDLMLAFCERAAEAGIPLYLRIVGGFSPPFRALTDDEREQVASDIEASGAAVVWVGTGQPKQELWMAQMRGRLSAPLLVGVGAAFDFHAGLVPQAPPWMQSRGLEWLYRLVREPRRLWRRYARYNPLFVLSFARQYARHRLGRG